MRELEYKFPEEDGVKGGEVYINENLAPSTRTLFWRVRTFKRENKYRFAWTKDGNCYLRKTEGSPVFHIRTELDLNDLPKTSNHPPVCTPTNSTSRFEPIPSPIPPSETKNKNTTPSLTPPSAPNQETTTLTSNDSNTTMDTEEKSS